MKYLLLIGVFAFFSNSCESSNKEKEPLKKSINSSDLSKNLKEPITNSANCEVQIEGKDLIIVCDNKRTIYKDLIANEMSISTELLDKKDGEFSLLYDLNASTTKVKEKYDFIYFSGKLFLIYKEYIKFGREGVLFNRLYLDNFDMYQKTIDDLQSLGNSHKEEYNKDKITGSIYNSQNKLFAHVTYETSIENFYINYPDLNKSNFIIDNVELANNQAYNLEQIGANSFSKYILNEIIKQYPNRILAFLNLADVDWKLGNKEEAKKNYNIYISLMKKLNKNLDKIPKRVYERTK